MKGVLVFCGSREGVKPEFGAAADALGAGLARAGFRLVYGGGSIGLMRRLADSALAAGGSVTGVIPRFLADREVAHTGLTELVQVDSMHARKQVMLARADAVVTLPGGYGTLDETVEALTWRQLRLHDKPILICNVAGWADALLAAFDAMRISGFAYGDALYEVFPDVGSTLARLGGCV